MHKNFMQNINILISKNTFFTEHNTFDLFVATKMGRFGQKRSLKKA